METRVLCRSRSIGGRTRKCPVQLSVGDILQRDGKVRYIVSNGRVNLTSYVELQLLETEQKRQIVSRNNIT